MAEESTSSESRPLTKAVFTCASLHAGILLGFESEEDWFDWRLENDPRFLKRMEKARQSVRSGKGIAGDEIEAEERRKGR